MTETPDSSPNTPGYEGYALDAENAAEMARLMVQDQVLILPVPAWVAANGPSFGFRVSQGGVSLCLTPRS